MTSLWRLALMFLLIGMPVGAQAQQIAVVGGEHADFTRLTLSRLPQGTWTLEAIEGGYQLQAAGSGARFDLGRAFDKIQRDRVRELVPLGPVLRIDLGCDCHIEPFQFRESYLVLDIKSGAPPASVSADVPTVPPPAVALPLGPVPPLATPVPSAAARLTEALVDADAIDDRTRQIESDLAQSVARAATQGLLTPSGSPPDARTPSPNDGGGTMVPRPDTSPPSILSRPPDPDAVGVASQTSVDRDLHIRFGTDAGGTATPPARAGTSACLPMEFFDTSTWIDTRSFQDQISERRLYLTSETDRVPAGAAEDLARTYLGFGFGTEAMAVLGVDLAQSQERQVLRLIGAIIDEQPKPYADLESQITCDGPAALWALVASAADSPARGGDADAILRAYQNLPEPLLHLLAPRLAERFLSLGDVDAADAVLNRFLPSTADGSTEKGIAEAQLAGEIEAPAAAIAALETLAREDTRMTPEALVSMLELARSEGTTPAPDLIALVAAQRFENRRDPIHDELLAAEVRLMSDLDRFDEAFELLEQTDGSAEPDLLGALENEVTAALTERGTNRDFLGRVLIADLARIAPEVQNRVAARLIALGLPDPAKSLLISPASGSAAAERTYLLAEIALLKDDPAAAIRYLGARSDARAAALRQRATLALGPLATGSGSQARPLDPTEDPLTAWRSGAWADLAASDDPVLQEAAAAMLDQAGGQGGPIPPSLEAGQSALASSARSRALIDQLLAKFQSPEG